MQQENQRAEQYILTNAITIKALVKLLIEKNLISDQELTAVIKLVREEALDQVEE